MPCKEVMEEKNMKKATIRDVAKAAGVSQSTVSRVLNNNGYVGEDARRRVEEAMEALHYSPSAIAVCLSKSRSRMIGVIVPQIFAPFSARCITLQTALWSGTVTAFCCVIPTKA